MQSFFLVIYFLDFLTDLCRNRFQFQIASASCLHAALAVDILAQFVSGGGTNPIVG